MKRYQVFISSTLIDLVDERKELIYKLLEADFLPAGMELFLASTDSSWNVIEKTMDISDYYILIIGFRYGSLTKEGISFTEKEYNYAVKKKIPVLAFIQDRDAAVKASNREQDPEKIKKLDEFINRVKSERTVVDNWNDKDELLYKILATLLKETQSDCAPVLGWYRFPQTSKGKMYRKEETTQKCATLIINALPGTTAEKIKNDAKEGEYKDLVKHNYYLWDIISDLKIKGNIEESHIEVIKQYLVDKKQELSALNKVYLFYAGPGGIAIHIGSIFANVSYKVDIIQCSSGKYHYFGSIKG